MYMIRYFLTNPDRAFSIIGKSFKTSAISKNYAKYAFPSLVPLTNACNFHRVNCMLSYFNLDETWLLFVNGKS